MTESYARKTVTTEAGVIAARGNPLPEARRRWLAASLRVLVALPLLILPVWLAAAPDALAQDPPKQIFYVPLPDNEILQALDTVDTSGGSQPASPIRSIISIAIGSTGTRVYYDHWEDGAYEAALESPTNPWTSSNTDGTETWGDSDLSNGCPPRINNAANPCANPSDDHLDAGDIITLDNEVPVGGTYDNYTRSASEVRYDGRDKIGVTYPVAITRAGWAVGGSDPTGSLLAGAVEVSDTETWGTEFYAPVGEDTASTTNAWEYTALFVMSRELNTKIDVDTDGDGAYDFTNVDLDEGVCRVYRVDEGAKVATRDGKLVQVHMLTGDIGSNYEMRWYLLVPRAYWSNEYVGPVGTTTAGCTSIWAYNPGGSTINILVDLPGTGDDTNFTIGADQNEEWKPVGDGQAIHLTSEGGEPFLPIAQIDCDDTNDGQKHDWGYPLLPFDLLTTQALVGWAPGCTTDCGCPDNCTASRTLVFVAALADTTIYVDKDRSGVECSDGSGADETISASALVSYKVSDDPGEGGEGDRDMTGARLLTCDGTEIAVAWGQVPGSYTLYEAESLDMGTVILPFGSDISLQKDVDQSLVPPGTEVVYTYLVRNFGTSLTDISVEDDTCSPVQAVLDGHPYNIGDINDNDRLESGEVWEFTCTATIWLDTTNVAIALGTPDDITYYASVPDEETVTLFRPATIGNYVWLDENGDGVQDAGEGGIPNLTVELQDGSCTPGDTCPTTLTDEDGGYTFTGVPEGSYKVVIVDPPAGMDPTYDEDGTGTPHQAAVTVVAGEEHLTSDFGYNWVPPADTIGNTGNGAIGDRVWIDLHNNGLQEPGEPGLGGVTVHLYTDPDGDGVYDNPAGTTVTDPAGYYIFDDLSPGSYVVEVEPPSGYDQTGDPDEAGLCTFCDSKTTYPLVLAPGDVYVNADFGYRNTLDSWPIGDTIYLDANGNGAQDTGEPGIYGVTVALLDENGFIIATEVTDMNGLYVFLGLPPGHDYTVWVNDTENVLGELVQTGDPDELGVCTTCDARSTVTGLSAADDTRDFGYAPPGHADGDGLIGDTIFLDRNNNSLSEYEGEGLEGVRVELWNQANDELLAVTTTNENGNYYFGGLDPTAIYNVTVDTSTLPGGGTGLQNHVDPNGGANSTARRNLSTVGPIDLAADFGYRVQAAGDRNTISGTLWQDTDANGTLDGDEPIRFLPLPVVLLDPDGNIVGQTVTDANGDFSFTGLPDGVYTVDVTDDRNVLNGYWHSLGQANLNDNSQIEPYTVEVTLGQRDVDWADFGYYRDPGQIGDFVWDDQNGDGFQDLSEPGLPGVKVTLNIEYPDGTTDSVVTFTDANGKYAFNNLLLDEGYDGVGVIGVGGDEPLHTVVVDPPLSYLPSPIHADPDPEKDSGDPTGELALPLQGAPLDGFTDPVDSTIDFGFVYFELEFGDAPEAGIAYPAAGTPGAFPTCVNSGPAGWIQHGLGWAHFTVAGAPQLPWDAELEGDGGFCPFPGCFPTYDDDECYQDGDAGLMFPEPYTISGVSGQVVPCPGWAGSLLGGLCQTAQWGVDIDIFVVNNMPVDGFVNVLMDWDQSGFWAGASVCPTAAAPEHVLVDFLVPVGYSGPLSALGPPPFLIGPNPGHVWARFSITEVPVGTQDWNGEGAFEDGETEDYLLLVSEEAASVGDFVWWDVNYNGQQDVGEPGIPGVQLDLTGGATSLSTTTDANGFYGFSNLPAGTFTIQIPASEFAAGGPLENWFPTQYQVPPPITDSDAHPVTNSAQVTLSAAEANNSIDFGYDIAASYEITKVLNTEGPIRIGDLISFTIRITNTGDSVITVLPLQDTYDNTYLTFTFANPVTDDNNNDGTLDWSDLTAAAPNGFNQDLAPGNAFEVVVYFVAREDTYGLGPDAETIDTAIVAGAVGDPDGEQGPLPPLDSLPRQEASAGVRIERPTGDVVSAFGASVQKEGVLVAWETANEVDLLGFNLLRWRVDHDGDGRWVRVNSDLIAAEQSGTSGGEAYQHLDSGLARGTYVYTLQLVKLDGSTEDYGAVTVTVVRWGQYLPLILR